MDDRLMDEFQVRLNKLVRTEEFRQHILKYVDVIPNDFNISLSVDDNGEICEIWYGIIHYGYENSSKDAATDYIYSNLSLISDLLSRFKTNDF